MTATSTLLRWFRSAARSLPWRTEPRDPYRVLVSELMLQQTQVQRVVPLFEAFMARFPDLEALSAASEDEVLEAWSGLGYYRRARLLHRLAREVVAKAGSLPEEVAELTRLPGVGPYTAAAVSSLAFGRAEPVVDGNVMRVASRVLTLDDPRSATGRRQVADWVRGLYGDQRPGEVNEAVMELGATVCLPKSPLCETCPLAGECQARRTDFVELYPAPRRVRATEAHRWVAACCIDPAGRWLLRRVDHGPILRGLWLPPLADLEQGSDAARAALDIVPVQPEGEPQELPPVLHSITHRRITVHPVALVTGASPAVEDGWCWADPRRPGVPTSSLLTKLMAVVGRS